MSEQPFLSIIIPAYKEAERIHKSLEAIIEYEKSHDFPIEVLIVLDGTPDDSLGVAEKYRDRIKGLKIIDRKENKGKGYTVKQGILEAKGKYILFTDADNATPIDQVDKLLKYKDEYPVVIGSRYITSGKLAIPQSFVRKTGGRFLNLIIRMLAVGGIRDTQCGFKMFKHNVAKEIFKRMTFERFSFDIEVLAIARLHKYKIKEVGITWYDDPHSTVSPIKDGFKMIRDAWTVNRNIAKGIYK
ncbi:MAG: glycosyltransferase family 2 protein [Candidatus Berkelbacteria bacterium]|nr:glycosyltransferase family 2 protein [Candidatus Berkelbacteria bacterium]